MNEATLQQQAERLKAFAAMGGFSVTLAEAQQGVLDAEVADRNGILPSLAQTLAQIR